MPVYICVCILYKLPQYMHACYMNVCLLFSFFSGTNFLGLLSTNYGRKTCKTFKYVYIQLTYASRQHTTACTGYSCPKYIDARVKIILAYNDQFRQHVHNPCEIIINHQNSFWLSEHVSRQRCCISRNSLSMRLHPLSGFVSVALAADETLRRPAT